MSQLQARIKTDGDILVVQFSGRVDVESAIPFRVACRQALAKKKVVFDFAQLNFVGSTGMLAFLEALRDYCRENQGQVKFASIGIELHRVLSATSLINIEAHETSTQAIEAFRNPQVRMAPVPFPVAAPVQFEVVIPKVADEMSASDLLASRYAAEDSKEKYGGEYGGEYEGEYDADM